MHLFCPKKAKWGQSITTAVRAPSLLWSTEVPWLITGVSPYVLGSPADGAWCSPGFLVQVLRILQKTQPFPAPTSIDSSMSIRLFTYPSPTSGYIDLLTSSYLLQYVGPGPSGTGHSPGNLFLSGSGQYSTIWLWEDATQSLSSLGSEESIEENHLAHFILFK